MKINKEKIVVFDMDETLGYFIELGIFWELLKKYAKNKNENVEKIFTQEYFNNLLDIFTEFTRPNILNILNFIKEKKKEKNCKSVMIYTNNQGPKEWSYLITNYFHYKLKYKLFDRIICAFKLNGKQLEVCRTTHEKTMKDLTRCSKLPENVEICYLDDTYYPDMNKENVYYIKIKPYVYDLEFKEMINRYLKKSNISNKIIYNDEEEFINFMEKNIKNYEFVNVEKKEDEYEIDKIISKKILMHLHIFFNKSEIESKRSVKKDIRINKLKTRKRR